MKYGVIACDPPWNFATHSDKGRGRCAKYPTLDSKSLCELPVDSVAAKDCALFMWTTSPHLPQALKVVSAWGFRYSTVAFVWAKQNPSGEGWHSGTGYTTRANAEFMILGTKGSLNRVAMDVQQLVIAPRLRHSEKPLEVHRRIERLLGDRPRLELFARRTVPGWTCIGNEITGRDIREDLALLAGAEG